MVYWRIVFGHPEYLIRSSSFFKKLLAPHTDSWNYLDNMFLVCFLCPIVGPCICLFLFHQAFKEKGILSFVLNPKLVFMQSVFGSMLLIILVAYAHRKNQMQKFSLD
ncbi:MAG: hypothetical protein CM1200mP16_15070 [Nitrospina sp.]|nr:MAG: hypothetical protein CM1200mP16_15070 [Nitrospina sp.]